MPARSLPARSMPVPATSSLPSRRLGRSGLSVPALGFGGAPLGDLYALLDEDEAQGTVLAALKGGMTLLDTSPLYGHGLSEHRIGAALRRAGRPHCVISTKIGRVMEPFAPRGDGSGYLGGLPHGARFDYSYDGAMRALEQSMLRLGVNRIDIALIHDVDPWAHGEALDQRFREAMRGAYRALDDLRSQGVIKAIGVGVNDAAICARFARAGDFDAMLLAGRYSLLEQPALADFLPLAQAKNIGVMLGGVFNSGILASGVTGGAKYNYRHAPPEVIDKVSRLEALCARHGVRLMAAALHFALAHPAVSCLVLGAVSPREVEEQIAAFHAVIPAAFWQEARQAGLISAAASIPEEPHAN